MPVPWPRIGSGRSTRMPTTSELRTRDWAACLHAYSPHTLGISVSCSLGWAACILPALATPTTVLGLTSLLSLARAPNLFLVQPQQRACCHSFDRPRCCLHHWSASGRAGSTTTGLYLALDGSPTSTAPSSAAALSSGLTTIGGIDPVTECLWQTDVAHHHLAIGVVFILAGHLYKTDFGLGVAVADILASHQMGLFNSWHLQLALALAMQGSLSVWFGHLLVTLPAYPFLVTDYATVLSLFTHHQWIGGFFIVGGAAHASMALIFDCNLRSQAFIARVMSQKNAIVVHLNWVCIFLGFHSFGLYIHNDTLAALGRGLDQFSDQAIVLAPVLARWIQAQFVEPSVSIQGLHVAGRVFGLGTADTLVHHVHAFTIHVTALILLKGSLYARSSRLVPDKARLGFRFPCDGPGRGGTCQVSAWDHIFLGLFWMYNAISVVVFHFSWKLQSDVWASLSGTGLRHLTARNFAI